MVDRVVLWSKVRVAPDAIVLTINGLTGDCNRRIQSTDKNIFEDKLGLNIQKSTFSGYVQVQVAYHRKTAEFGVFLKDVGPRIKIYCRITPQQYQF
jgi:hypothetical protein